MNYLHGAGSSASAPLQPLDRPQNFYGNLITTKNALIIWGAISAVAFPILLSGIIFNADPFQHQHMGRNIAMIVCGGIGLVYATMIPLVVHAEREKRDRTWKAIETLRTSLQKGNSPDETAKVCQTLYHTLINPHDQPSNTVRA